MSAARKLQNGSVIVVVASVILLISSLLAGVTLVQQNQNINEEAASCYDRCRKEKGKGRKYCNNECGTEYNFAGVDTKVYEPAEPKQQTATVATEEDLAREKSECLTDGNVWRNNTCSTQTQTQNPDLNDLTQDEIDFITDTKEKLKDDEITPISPTDNNIQNIPEKLKDDEITPAITTTNTTKKKIGENCTTNTDCDSNNCQSVPGAKLCVEKGVNTEQIAQSYKQAQDPKKTNLYLGETCSVNYQCLSDYCNNGICAKKPTELLEAERQKQLELFTTGSESGSGEKTTETAKKPTILDNLSKYFNSENQPELPENFNPQLSAISLTGGQSATLPIEPCSNKVGIEYTECVNQTLAGTKAGNTSGLVAYSGAAGITSSGVMTGLFYAGTTYQTIRAGDVCSIEPDSKQCKEELAYTALSYVNLATVKNLLGLTPKAATYLNTGVNAVNVGADLYVANQVCGDGEYASDLGCKIAIGATFLDLGGSVLDANALIPKPKRPAQINNLPIPPNPGEAISIKSVLQNPPLSTAQIDPTPVELLSQKITRSANENLDSFLLSPQCSVIHLIITEYQLHLRILDL